MIIAWYLGMAYLFLLCTELFITNPDSLREDNFQVEYYLEKLTVQKSLTMLLLVQIYKVSPI